MNKELVEKIIEYLSIAKFLKRDSPLKDYQRANFLAWTLATELPGDLYKKMARVLIFPTSTENNIPVFIAYLRTELMGKFNYLDYDAILQHYPGIGENITDKDKVNLG